MLIHCFFIVLCAPTRLFCHGRTQLTLRQQMVSRCVNFKSSPSSPTLPQCLQIFTDNAFVLEILFWEKYEVLWTKEKQLPKKVVKHQSWRSFYYLRTFPQPVSPYCKNIYIIHITAPVSKSVKDKQIAISALYNFLKIKTQTSVLNSINITYDKGYINVITKKNFYSQYILKLDIELTLDNLRNVICTI